MKFRIIFFLVLLVPIPFNPSVAAPLSSMKLTYDANGSPIRIVATAYELVIVDPLSSRPLDRWELVNFAKIAQVEILQAPGSIIENQVFEGITLTLTDSPSSIIRNNTFLGIRSTSSVSALKVVNSPDTIISGNIINDVTLTNDEFQSRQTYISSGIEVDSSPNVLVSDNSISNIRASAAPLARTLALGIRTVFSNNVAIENNFLANLSSSVSVNRVFGIYLFKSNQSLITDNAMENLFGHNPQFATYVAGIYVETSENQTIVANSVKQLESRGTSISTGIRLYNVQNIMINENEISFVSSGQNAFGMFFTLVNLGDVQGNYIENVTSLVGLETSAFNLEDTNFLNIQENHAVFVDRLVSLNGQSGQNLIFNNILNEMPIGDEEVGPLISPHSNIQYRVDSNETYFISWVVIDTDPAAYQIFRNDILFDEGEWISGVPIILDVSNLEEGEYNYTLVVNDTQGNIAKDTVFVSVLPRNFLSDGADYIRNIQQGLTLQNLVNLSPFIIFIYLAIELLRLQYRTQKRKKLIKKREIRKSLEEIKNRPELIVDKIFTHREDND
ncbi:MAG: hypothetical protein D6732_27895 [Methanobacteriota archaeon]|nr:MAG: hypothetical protein D6732_27895 [Euryarchaeota archaeon]